MMYRVTMIVPFHPFLGFIFLKKQLPHWRLEGTIWATWTQKSTFFPEHVRSFILKYDKYKLNDDRTVVSLVIIHAVVFKIIINVLRPIRVHGSHLGFTNETKSKITFLLGYLRNICSEFDDRQCSCSWEAEKVSANQSPWQPSWISNCNAQ